MLNFWNRVKKDRHIEADRLTLESRTFMAVDLELYKMDKIRVNFILASVMW